MSIARLALRGLIGPLFIGHGTQKLFGWFGGHGLEGTAGFFDSQLGLKPGRRHAAAAGAAETIGGVLLTLGALTPIACATLSGPMVTAIRKVHASNGPWVTGGGWEYNAVLLAAFAVLTEAGPGKPSVDAAKFPQFHGPALAVMQLGAGVLGSYLATEVFNDAKQDAGAAGGAERTDDGRFAAESNGSAEAEPAGTSTGTA